MHSSVSLRAFFYCCCCGSKTNICIAFDVPSYLSTLRLYSAVGVRLLFFFSIRIAMKLVGAVALDLHGNCYVVFFLLLQCCNFFLLKIIIT